MGLCIVRSWENNLTNPSHNVVEILAIGRIVLIMSWCNTALDNIHITALNCFGILRQPDYTLCCFDLLLLLLRTSSPLMNVWETRIFSAIRTSLPCSAFGCHHISCNYATIYVLFAYALCNLFPLIRRLTPCNHPLGLEWYMINCRESWVPTSLGCFTPVVMPSSFLHFLIFVSVTSD